MAKQETQVSTQQQLRQQLSNMTNEFKTALPPHIPVERFVRTILTAVNSNPDLVNADRRSLFESAMKAAQDGLLPDGREGAFVVYRTKVGGKESQNYIQKCQWMPMVGGICKKVRNSGELATLDSQVVHEKDEYDSWTDEKGPHFKHKKARGERGKPIITYAYATTKDGSFFFEELTEEDIQAIRSASKAKDSGPWAGPFADEMRRKSAVRRLAKYRLPSSTDLDTVIRRDDELFDFSKPSEDDILPLQKPTTITPQLEEGPSIEDVDGEFNQLIVNMTVDNFAEMKVEAFKLFKHVKGDEKKLIDMTKTLNARQKDLGL